MKTDTAYHISYGRHSLIPECCIQFYVTEWHPFFENKWRGTTYDDMINKSGWGYVPCPKCFFTGQQVKIRLCDVECGRACYKDFA